MRASDHEVDCLLLTMLDGAEPYPFSRLGFELRRRLPALERPGGIKRIVLEAEDLGLVTWAEEERYNASTTFTADGRAEALRLRAAELDPAGARAGDATGVSAEARRLPVPSETAHPASSAPAAARPQPASAKPPVVRLPTAKPVVPVLSGASARPIASTPETVNPAAQSGAPASAASAPPVVAERPEPVRRAVNQYRH